jgi:hypothetical protein
MLTQRVNDCLGRSAKTHVCRIMVQSLGGILCGLLSVPGAFGEVKNFTPNHSGIGEKVVQRIQSRNDFSKRRDPFKPIKKRRAISSTSRKSSPEPPQLRAIPATNSTLKNPNWKLLGIIHGHNGRQAVIQISPQERVFVRSGLEVVRSGWIIKAISKEEVLLEHSSPSTSVEGFSQPKVFILSFSTLGKPS